jgi:hypothetical protein
MSTVSSNENGTFLDMLQTAAQSGNKDMERAMYQSMANALNPSLLEYSRGGGIETRVNKANIANQQRQNNQENTALWNAGMAPDASLSGGWSPVVKQGPRAKGGAGISMAASLTQQRAPMKNRWQEIQDHAQMMQKTASEGRLRNQLDLEKAQQEQKLKLQMLQRLMAQFKSGKGSRGGEGYTSQIFNNAGAPQVVRLPNKEAGQGQQMLMQLLSKFGG